MLKKIVCIIFCMILLSLNVNAEAYPSYMYLANGEITAAPQPFLVKDVLFGEDFGIDTLSGAEHIFCSEDNTIYVVNSAKNEIVYLTSKGKTGKLSSFKINGKPDKFKNPQGIFVTENEMYVCDYENNRILIINLKTKAAKVIANVESPILDSDFVFKPQKIAVDSHGRIYCISDGQYNGLMVFDNDLKFSGFVGANKTSVSLMDRFWRLISTDAQQSQQSIFIPTEFAGIAIDKDDFIYTTTDTVDNYDPASSEPIRRQSPGGENILRYEGKNYPIGDIKYTYNTDSFSGPSRFCDITVWDNMMYSVLDQTRNRIFTYDINGNLLFIYGSYGENKGYFEQPKSIKQCNNRLFVLDSKTGSITILAPTEYAQCIITAVEYTSNSDYNSALSAWSKVLDYNSNNELAYLNISNLLFNQGNYLSAMEYAKKANNPTAYSTAFAQHKTKLIGNNIKNIVFGFIIIAAAIFILSKILKRYAVISRLRARFKTFDSLCYGGYIFYAPFDGFWDQKREKKGNVLSGIVIMFLLFLSFAFSKHFTSFSFSSPADELSQFNLLLELCKSILPIMLWCISNWCITALTEGSGNFKDIFIASNFAILPYIISSFTVTILSNLLTADKAAVLGIVTTIGIIYSVFLMIAANSSIHECSFAKACGTIVLTLIGMAVIVFISVLFFNLINKFFDFVISVYNELRLRT